MDPLTHTLFGASLAATDLGRKTRLATPALIIGANLPDVDVLSYFRGGDFALGFRRGWTHGVLALVVLPALLAGLLWLWDKRRGRRDLERKPLAPGWLLGLSYFACLTHPCLDWLNNYGMRWWMPFRDTWYYGDSVFIMDPWLWLVLGTGWLIGRKPARGTAIGAVATATLVVWLVASRAPAYLPVVGSVFAVLLVAFFWQPKAGWLTAHRTATLGLLSATLYIGILISIHSATVSRVQQMLPEHGVDSFDELLAGPTPANPLAWDIVVGTEKVYRWGRLDWLDGGNLVLSEGELPAARELPQWNAIVASGQSPGFLRWTRFPWWEASHGGETRQIYLMDARYARHRTVGFGGAVFQLPAD